MKLLHTLLTSMMGKVCSLSLIDEKRKYDYALPILHLQASICISLASQVLWLHYLEEKLCSYNNYMLKLQVRY